jgi:glyceraldehyde 3-phosphate dehydrogenase
MQTTLENKNLLGINGSGRIGKLTLWYHISVGHFDGYVVNVGREIGKSLDDMIHSVLTDSTYGEMGKFIYGYRGKDIDVQITDREKGIVNIDGVPVKFLRSERNPKNIDWAKHRVRLVVDCTGAFVDPTVDANSAKGSLRGHLESGAQHVILSAPFKIKDSSQKMPPDSKMFVYGINHTEFNPTNDHILSAASCTTTGLAHMVKPLLESEHTSRILTASMATIHAATNTQSILDSMPKAGASDLRKNRSVFNNIILSTTGAAKALEKVLPEIQRIGFMADSVRIPTNTVSLILLNVTFHSPMKENKEPLINKDLINDIFREAAKGSQKDLLFYTDKQNVSSCLQGIEAAVIIEGYQTHTRTGYMSVPKEVLTAYGLDESKQIEIPVTHAKIFGWYDNEFGSYVYSLGKLAIYVDKQIH